MFRRLFKKKAKSQSHSSPLHAVDDGYLDTFQKFDTDTQTLRQFHDASQGLLQGIELMLSNLQLLMETSSKMGKQASTWIDLLNGVNTIMVVLLPQLQKALQVSVLKPLRALNIMREEVNRRSEQRSLLWKEYEHARRALNKLQTKGEKKAHKKNSGDIEKFAGVRSQAVQRLSSAQDAAQALTESLIQEMEVMQRARKGIQTRVQQHAYKWVQCMFEGLSAAIKPSSEESSSPSPPARTPAEWVSPAAARRTSSYIPMAVLRQAMKGPAAPREDEEEGEEVLVNTLDNFSAAGAAKPQGDVCSLEAVNEEAAAKERDTAQDEGSNLRQSAASSSPSQRNVASEEGTPNSTEELTVDTTQSTGKVADEGVGHGEKGHEGQGKRQDQASPPPSLHFSHPAVISQGSSTCETDTQDSESSPVVIERDNTSVLEEEEGDTVMLSTRVSSTHTKSTSDALSLTPSKASKPSPVSTPTAVPARSSSAAAFRDALAALDKLCHVETIAGTPWWLWAFNQARVAVAVATEEGNSLRRLVHAHSRLQRSVPLAVLPSAGAGSATTAPVPMAMLPHVGLLSLQEQATPSAVLGPSAATPSLSPSSADAVHARQARTAKTTFFSSVPWLRHLASWLDAPTLTVCRVLNTSCRVAIDDVSVWTECALRGGMVRCRRRWWAWIMGVGHAPPPGWSYVAQTRGIRCMHGEPQRGEGLHSPLGRRGSRSSKGRERKTPEQPHTRRGWVNGVDICMPGEWPILSAMAEAEAERAASEVVTSSEQEEWRWVKELQQDVQRTAAPLSAGVACRSDVARHSGSDADSNSEEEEGEGRSQGWQTRVGKEDIRQLVFVLVLTNADLHFTQGMTLIAAHILSTMSSIRDAFNILKVMSEVHFSGMWNQNTLLEPLHELLRQHETTVKHFLPTINQHLKECCIEAPSYASRWYLTAFADPSTLPHEASLRVWDAFLAAGPQVLHEVSLRVLHELQNIVLVGSMEQARKALRYPVQYNAEATAEQWLRPLPSLFVSAPSTSKWEGSSEHSSLP